MRTPKYYVDSFWGDLANALVFRPVYREGAKVEPTVHEDMRSPKVRVNSFAGDLANALTFRPVYREPFPPKKDEGSNSCNCDKGKDSPKG